MLEPSSAYQLSDNTAQPVTRRHAGFFSLSDLMGGQSMSPEFGPVILHDGTGCPLAIGTVIRVTVELSPGDLLTVVDTVQLAGSAWFWENWLTPFADGTLCGRVVAYAVQRSDALSILQRITAAPEADTANDDMVPA